MLDLLFLGGTTKTIKCFPTINWSLNYCLCVIILSLLCVLHLCVQQRERGREGRGGGGREGSFFWVI